MKALTICQPYAELICRGEKVIENRDWFTPYRGPLLIHAGKSRAWLDPGDVERYPDMPFGAIVALADLVACLYRHAASWPAEYAALRSSCHANGPWCWMLSGVRRLDSPVACGGFQGLWIPAPDILVAVGGGGVMAPFKDGVSLNTIERVGLEVKYLRISAGPQRGKYVHQLVAEAKLGRALLPGEEVDHVNGDTLDCDWSNLEVRDGSGHAKLTRQRATAKRRARRQIVEEGSVRL